VAASQFGPNLVSLMTVLMGCYRLSKRQVVALLDTCFGVQVAASSVVNQQQVMSAALAQPVDELQAYVQRQSACNVDETSWRQAEQTKQSWLWVVVTALVLLSGTVDYSEGRSSGWKMGSFLTKNSFGNRSICFSNHR
jgi:transposase